MPDVWVVTVPRDGQSSELIRADDVRHVRIAGEPRRVLALARQSSGSASWVELAATPSWGAMRRAAVVPPLLPELPAEFHLSLIAALGQARTAAEGELPVLVHAALADGVWSWQANRWDTYMTRVAAQPYALS